MHYFQLLEYGAWGLSALLGLWMLTDLIRTDRTYSEEMLTSSQEGEIEDELIVDLHQGGHK
jgi:hypothetical protein